MVLRLRLRLHPLRRPAQATTTAVQLSLVTRPPRPRKTTGSQPAHVSVKLMMLRLRLRLLHRPVLRLRLLQGRLPRHP
jgi:hypothetical protein